MEIPSSSASMDTDVNGAPPSTTVAPSSAPSKPSFQALKPHEMSNGKVQYRKISVPPHRFSPLKRNWMEIYTPIYEQMKIDIRMNLKV
jgi:RNA-binding protein PNO1